MVKQFELKTGVKITDNNNLIQVELPGEENRSTTFKNLMKLWH